MSKNGQIKGLEKLIKRLEASEKTIQPKIDIIAEAVTRDMVGMAKQLAPINDGFLKGSIRKEKSKHGYKVVVGAKYAAYVEFGTGVKVQIPPEFADLAANFKTSTKGSFKEGLQNIKDWCRRKGIPEEAAYPILVSLITNGQRAQPFLYPSWVKGKQLYIEDLKDLLKKEFK